MWTQLTERREVYRTYCELCTTMWVCVCALRENNSARWNNAEKRAHITVQINHNVMTMAHIALYSCTQCSMHIAWNQTPEAVNTQKRNRERETSARHANTIASQSRQKKHFNIVILPLFFNYVCVFFSLQIIFFLSLSVVICLFLSFIPLFLKVLLLFLINIFLIIRLFCF